MKLRYIIFLLLAVSSLTFAQKKRYLISPFQEVIPLDEKQSAKMLVQARQEESVRAQNAACSNTVHDGFQIEQFAPPYSNFGATHKDVMGEWFVSNFTGTIDTVFWQTLGNVGAKDSTIYIRIHRSAITPTAGPGVVPGPYLPPCQNWGYWRNTNDGDNRVAAFIEDATDTNWVSTIAGVTPSYPPFATDAEGNSELWGLGGYPATDHAGTGLGRTNFAVMRELPLPPTLDVVKGDVFFVSMRVNSENSHPFPLDARTEFLAAGFDSRTEGYQDFYPSRNWKFYEHDSGPSNCAGVPTAQVKRGWVARGGFDNADNRLVAAYLFWYSITTSDNVPPTLLSYTSLGTTLSTGPQTVDCEWEDCDPSNPANAGVSAAYLVYSVDGGADHTVQMSDLGGNSFTAEIPGQPVWSSIFYRLVAVDAESLVTVRPITTYRVVGYQNEFFKTVADTCADVSIKTTGTEISSESFFVAPASTALNPKDDGTAGPFDLGGNFYLFGQPLRYAWVGVNCAIALTETATDTLDVNANGSYTTGYSFPGSVQNEQRDTSVNGRKPKNFIAPYWNDLFYGDTVIPGDQWGHIRYQDLGCQFVVEWGGDTLGVFPAAGDKFKDKMTFRVVLNKCDGTIQFQYPEVGQAGLDTLATVGIQCDTLAALGNTAPWAFINRFNGPPETNPANGKCFKISQLYSPYSRAGWNIVSVPTIPLGSNYAKNNLFPGAISQAFAYTTAYTAADPLENRKGYWLKFDNAAYHGVAVGTSINVDSIPVVAGWNLIGSISCPVQTSTITDPVVTGATYYEYSGGYVAVSKLTPYKGSWVKATANGTIHLDCSLQGAFAKDEPTYTQLDGSSKIVISDSRDGKQTLYLMNESSLKVSVDRYELPPTPPTEVFDARFGSGRFVETYSTEKGKSTEYTINIQSSTYPVSVQYDIVVAGKSVIASEMSEGKSITNTILTGRGVIRITNPSVSSIKVKVVDGIDLPKNFALSQNYPNPFNPVTRFSVDIPNNANVEITVFDILGHKITTLLSGQQEAGSKSIEWDGKDSHGVSSPSGMYFVRMTAGDFSEVRKIMLLK